MYVLANRDLELSCDETVLRRSGGDVRGTYARVLIRMEERRRGCLLYTSLDDGGQMDFYGYAL